MSWSKMSVIVRRSFSPVAPRNITPIFSDLTPLVESSNSDLAPLVESTNFESSRAFNWSASMTKSSAQTIPYFSKMDSKARFSSATLSTVISKTNVKKNFSGGLEGSTGPRFRFGGSGARFESARNSPSGNVGFVGNESLGMSRWAIDLSLSFSSDGGVVSGSNPFQGIKSCSGLYGSRTPNLSGSVLGTEAKTKTKIAAVVSAPAYSHGLNSSLRATLGRATFARATFARATFARATFARATSGANSELRTGSSGFDRNHSGASLPISFARERASSVTLQEKPEPSRPRLRPLSNAVRE